MIPRRRIGEPRIPSHGRMSFSQKSAIAIGLSLFLALSSTGLSFAVWNSIASITASSSAATTQLSVAGISGLAHQYQTGAQAKVAQVTIANQGTAPLTYSLGIGTAAGPLAAGIAVTLWPKPAGACTTTVPASGTTSGTLAAPPALPAAVSSGAAGTSLNLCVLTTLTGTMAGTPPGSISPTFTITGTVGANWTVASAISVTQTVALEIAPPGTPVLTYTTMNSLSFAWAPSAGNATVTGYEIWRDGALIATVGPGVLTYTSAGLKNNTQHSHTVWARYTGDGGTGISSGTLTATTANTSDSWYSVVNPNSGRCVEAFNGNTVNGTSLVISDCRTSSSDSQHWQFEERGSDTFRVLAGHTSKYWAVESASSPVAEIWNWSGTDTRLWRIVTLAGDGTFHFVNVASGLCLAVPGASTSAGSVLTAETCGSGAGQVFSLVAVP